MGRGRGLTDPPEIRELKNDKAHAHRYAGLEYPVASKERATPPEHLSERAKEIFRSIVDEIDKMYPCSETYTMALTLYANNQEELEFLETFLRMNGHTYTDTKVIRTGKDQYEMCETIRKRPEAEIYKQCKDYARTLLNEFGLTGSARSKINMKAVGEKKKEEAANPFSQFGKPQLVKNR